MKNIFLALGALALTNCGSQNLADLKGGGGSEPDIVVKNGTDVVCVFEHGNVTVKSRLYKNSDGDLSWKNVYLLNFERPHRLLLTHNAFDYYKAYTTPDSDFDSETGLTRLHAVGDIKYQNNTQIYVNEMLVDTVGKSFIKINYVALTGLFTEKRSFELNESMTCSK